MGVFEHKEIIIMSMFNKRDIVALLLLGVLAEVAVASSFHNSEAVDTTIRVPEEFRNYQWQDQSNARKAETMLQSAQERANEIDRQFQLEMEQLKQARLNRLAKRGSMLRSRMTSEERAERRRKRAARRPRTTRSNSNSSANSGGF